MEREDTVGVDTNQAAMTVRIEETETIQVEIIAGIDMKTMITTDIQEDSLEKDLNIEETGETMTGIERDRATETEVTNTTTIGL